METWQIFSLFSLSAFTIEIFTAKCISGAIAVGCTLAAIGSFYQLESNGQISLFAFGIVFIMIVVKPHLKRRGYQKINLKWPSLTLFHKTGTISQDK